MNDSLNFSGGRFDTPGWDRRYKLPTVLAAYPGTCSLCGQSFKVGQRIWRTTRRNFSLLASWCCAKCAEHASQVSESSDSATRGTPTRDSGQASRPAVGYGPSAPNGAKGPADNGAPPDSAPRPGKGQGSLF
jgi:hypothetical protein